MHRNEQHGAQAGLGALMVPRFFDNKSILGGSNWLGYSVWVITVIFMCLVCFYFPD